MKKELPGIFKKNIDSSHSNNKKVFYTSEAKQEVKKVDEKEKNNPSLTSVEDKIRKLLRSSRYIFNIGVEIKTSKKTYDTKIAGKVKNSLVTVEGETIPIVDIEDIIIKDRF